LTCARIVPDGPDDVKNRMAERKKKEKKLVAKGPGNDDLAERIRKACRGLIYISETDEPIELFEGGVVEKVTMKTVLEQAGHPSNSPAEASDLHKFFTRLTRVEDWYPSERKADAKRFAKLKKILEEDLADTGVFKIGKIRLDVYVVGLDKDGRLIGIRTKAVET
jgi:hypothetical protein